MIAQCKENKLERRFLDFIWIMDGNNNDKNRSPTNTPSSLEADEKAEQILEYLHGSEAVVSPSRLPIPQDRPVFVATLPGSYIRAASLSRSSSSSSFMGGDAANNGQEEDATTTTLALQTQSTATSIPSSFSISPTALLQGHEEDENDTNHYLGDEQKEEEQEQEGEDHVGLPEATPVPEMPALRYATPEQSSPAESGVVQALLLTKNDSDHERHNGFAATSRSCCRILIGILLLVVIGAVGIGVGISASKSSLSSKPSSNDNNNSSLQGQGENQSGTHPFSNQLQHLTLQALQDKTSPQSRANAFMLADPDLQQYSRDRQMQRFALATLYYATNGDAWLRNDAWLDYTIHECEWYQNTVQTVCQDDLMIRLDLQQNKLQGILPAEVFLFPSLRYLDLSSNDIQGTAPTMHFGGAQNLEALILSHNQFTGQFTAELGFVASKLTEFRSDDNQFHGAVSGLLRLLPNLQSLNITKNLHSGTLPSALGQLVSTLLSLQVASNYISGQLPTELGALTHLQILDVADNPQIRGPIPTELNQLANLTVFRLSDTQLTGTISDEFCALHDAGQLLLEADCGSTLHCCVLS